ncbi:hypothetical protein FOZ61_001845, partial [Perkinsus olseni]
MFNDNDNMPKVFVPRVCPFGASASVSNFLRISELHCHLMRCLAMCNCFAYMDDFFPVELAECSGSAMEFFYFLHGLTGAKIKHAKTIPPAEETVLLGLQVSLVHGQCRVTLTPERKTRLHADIIALSKSTIVDSKVAGKLSFCCEALFGRLGRAPCRVLIRKSLGKPIADASVRSALSMLLQLLEAQHYARDLILETQLHSSLKPFICYSDASTSYGIGIFSPAQHQLPLFYGQLQLQLQQESINTLEMLAATTTIESLRFWCANKCLLLFTDNSTCQYLILRGSSPSERLNTMAGEFWRRLADLQIYHFFVAHVPSALNPADTLSRGECPYTNCGFP